MTPASGVEAPSSSPKPQRIVSQSLATDEVLLALPLGDRLLAVSGLVDDPRYSLVLGEASAVPRRVLRSAEEILALRPDVVFVASYTTSETVDQLRRAGAPVLQLVDFDTLDDVRANIRAIGLAVGEASGAEELVLELDRRVDRAVGGTLRTTVETTVKATGESSRQESLRRERPLRVLAWEAGVVIAGKTTFDDIVTRLGAVNVASEAGLEGWPRVGVERLAVWSPDLLILPASPGEEAATLAAVLEHPALRSSGLANPGRVAVVPTALFNTVSHHVATLVERLADLLAEARPLGAPASRPAETVEGSAALFPSRVGSPPEALGAP
jgi:iron complex transport system substrate-binding protein